MEIDRDEMASKKWEENGVKFVNPRSFVTEIKFDDIPESILMEVLIRLPVKLVFRFKLVCKQWLSVISDPSFVLMYISRASKSPQLQPWTFIFGTMHVDGSPGLDFSNHQLLGDIYCRDIRPPSLYVLRCPSAQHPDRKRYKVLRISNGLVLYGPCIVGDRFSYIANYNICNPITGQWTTLPPHARDFKIVSNGFVTHVENCVLTSYRVVRLNVLLKRSSVITFEVFSSEIGEWKDFNVRLDLKIRFACPMRPTSLNGILHWRTRKHGIIAYDPYHKPDSLRIIALPSDTSRAPNGIRSVCDVHQGRLRYFEMPNAYMPPHGFSSISVWVLNDYSAGYWSLQQRIGSSDILYDGILSGQSLSLNPIAFHPFDSNIVYLRYKNIIVSYNIKIRKFEAHGGQLDVGDYYKNMPCWWSAFLLVIPPWPIYISPPSFGVTED